VDDRSREVVDHQLQNRLDLLLAVAGIVGEGVILWLLVDIHNVRGMV
jgi:hypothetical protein